MENLEGKLSDEDFLQLMLNADVTMQNVWLLGLQTGSSQNTIVATGPVLLKELLQNILKRN